MSSPPPAPEFGPQGYLPERASKRARKIVLRAPLGLQWIIAAAIFGGLVLGAGVLWLRSAGPPGPPYVLAGPVEPVDAAPVVRVDAPPVWLVRGIGPVLAVPAEVASELAWCEASSHLESGDGRVWTATGRGLGTASLPTHPVTVHDGRVYVDPTATREGVRPAEDRADPAC